MSLGANVRATGESPFRHLFTIGRARGTAGAATNPVTTTDKRRELPPAALDFFEPEEIEALARAAAAGAHRTPEKRAVADDELTYRQWEDHRDGEMFRFAAYTGLRLGELRALQWKDVDLINRSVIVRRAVSAGVETTTSTSSPSGRATTVA